jgi:xyloglucan-specific exo-beta-1,4-glucanase
VTLTAVPAAGYVFGSWSGQTEGIGDLSQNPVTFQMGDRADNNRVITAGFVESGIQCSVTASADPGNGGSMQLQPAQPAGGYPVNQNVSVRAVAHSGYVFSHWTGDLNGIENPRSLLADEDKSFTAVFNPTVTVLANPAEGGSVLLEPESMHGYPAGTEVELTAKASKGYRFLSWEGDALGSSSSSTLTVDYPKTVTANFAAESPSRWWLWFILGLGGLLAGLVFLRLAYVRITGSAAREAYWIDE